MAKIDGIDITSLLWQEGSAPATPASTKWRLYFKTTGLFHKDDAGAEVGPLAAASALGAWTDYTPTITASGGSFNIGSSTLIGRYKLLDSKTGIFQINLIVTTGGAWNAGSGTWEFSLPSGWNAKNTANRTQIVPVHVLDSATTNFVCVGKIIANGTKITEVNVADGSNPRVLTNNAPITWATGDQININGMIELE